MWFELLHQFDGKSGDLVFVCVCVSAYKPVSICFSGEVLFTPLDQFASETAIQLKDMWFVVLCLCVCVCDCDCVCA